MLKLCRQYLNWIQNSVFEGELSEVKLKELKSKAKIIMNKDEDSLIIFKSREEKWLQKESLERKKTIWTPLFSGYLLSVWNKTLPQLKQSLHTHLKPIKNQAFTRLSTLGHNPVIRGRRFYCYIYNIKQPFVGFLSTFALKFRRPLIAPYWN